MDSHSSQSNQIQPVIGNYLITAAGLALLIFVAGLTTSTNGSGGDPPGSLALASGAAGDGVGVAYRAVNRTTRAFCRRAGAVISQVTD